MYYGTLFLRINIKKSTFKKKIIYFIEYIKSITHILLIIFFTLSMFPKELLNSLGNRQQKTKLS